MIDAMDQLRLLAAPDRLTVVKAQSAELGEEAHRCLEAVELFQERVAELNVRRAALLDEWERALDAMERKVP